MEGHVEARRNLAAYEEGRGRLDRALNHCIIAAECGNDDSLKAVQSLFKRLDVQQKMMILKPELIKRI